MGTTMLHDQLNLRVDPLPNEPNSRSDRSMITVSGIDRLGLTYGLSSLLDERNYNVHGCVSRRLNDIHSGQYIVEASYAEMSKTIRAEEVVARADQHQATHVDPAKGIRCELTAITPDSPGVLAKISQILFQTGINILNNDSITFETTGPGNLSNQTITACCITLTFDIPKDDKDEITKELYNALEYLESRYQWHLNLEKVKRLKKADRHENLESPRFDIFAPTLDN